MLVEGTISGTGFGWGCFGKYVIRRTVVKGKQAEGRVAVGVGEVELKALRDNVCVGDDDLRSVRTVAHVRFGCSSETTYCFWPPGCAATKAQKRRLLCIRLTLGQANSLHPPQPHPLVDQRTQRHEAASFHSVLLIRKDKDAALIHPFFPRRRAHHGQRLGRAHDEPTTYRPQRVPHLGLVGRGRRDGGHAAGANHAVQADGVGDGVGRDERDDVAGPQAVAADQRRGEGGGGVADLGVREARVGLRVDVVAGFTCVVGVGATRGGRGRVKEPLPEGEVGRHCGCVWFGLLVNGVRGLFLEGWYDGTVDIGVGGFE